VFAFVRHPTVTARRRRGARAPSRRGDGAVTDPSEAAGVDVNGALDRLPRVTVDVGGRCLPAFRSIAVLGFHVALVTAIAASLLNGVPLTVTVALSAIAALSFFAWALLRRAITGHETLVLVEYIAVAFAAVAAFLWAADAPVLPALDVLSTGLAVFLAFGRLGCATVGCCHGHPSGIGIHYGPEHGLSRRLTSARLFPVQLVEATALAMIALTCMLATALGRPGTATVWLAATYAVVRFGTEALRGDQRPLLLGVPVARLVAGAQLAASLVAAEAWLVDGPPGRTTYASAAALAVTTLCGVVLCRLRGVDPLARPAHLDEVWERVVTLGAIASTLEPISELTSAGLTLAVTAAPAGDAVHVSLSHPLHPVDRVAVALRPRDRDVLHGVTHLLLPVDLPPRSPHRAQRADVVASPSGAPDAAVSARADSYFTPAANGAK
jgi:hypothetical protein